MVRDAMRGRGKNSPHKKREEDGRDKREREIGKKKGEISSEISFFWGFPVFFWNFSFREEVRKKKKRRKKLNRREDEEEKKRRRRRKKKSRRKREKAQKRHCFFFFFSWKIPNGQPALVPIGKSCPAASTRHYSAQSFTALQCVYRKI